MTESIVFRGIGSLSRRKLTLKSLGRLNDAFQGRILIAVAALDPMRDLFMLQRLLAHAKRSDEKRGVSS